MPTNNVTDPITDQEIAFARLVLSGTMTDRRTAEAVGLNPDTAAYIKAKPRVCAYMLEHRAAVQQQLVEHDTGELRRFNVGRDKVLARLWEIANLAPEMTRNSMSSQVKALSMIVAIEGLIPDRLSARRAVSAQNQPAPPPVYPPFYVSEWMRTQQDGENVDPEPSPAQAQQDDQEETAPGTADDPPPPTTDPTAIELSSRRSSEGAQWRDLRFPAPSTPRKRHPRKPPHRSILPGPLGFPIPENPSKYKRASFPGDAELFSNMETRH